jgi:uncharacterized repeat protein (TIGR03803 family)
MVSETGSPKMNKPMKRQFKPGPALLILCAALASVSHSSAQVTEQVIKSFGFRTHPATTPQAPLIQGTDGALYGTTASGGISNAGTVFKMNPDGSGYTTLHTFIGSDGSAPYARLAQGREGGLYGTTVFGGTSNQGTVFRLNADGTGHTVLYNFLTIAGDGENPQAKLLQGADGALYGTTSSGGTNFAGTIFKLNTNGSSYVVLYTFDSSSAFPSGLAQGSDGTLYGANRYGGTNGAGTVFKINTDGTGYAQLYDFGANVYSGGGYSPSGDLLLASDGALYGATRLGGANSTGTIFKLNTAGTQFATRYNFGGNYGDPANPTDGLVEGNDGALYGTAGGGINGAGTIFKLNKNGTGFAVLSESVSSPSTLLQASDGALYGTTPAGGGENAGGVFKINPDGTGFGFVLSFGPGGGDGTFPTGGLVQDSDGVLYGTTSQGGTNYVGAVFKVNINGGGYVILHNFGTGGGDGAEPLAGLVLGSDGALYGTTYSGGTNNYGTVFKLNRDGTDYTVLYEFRGLLDHPNDGIGPWDRLLQGADGAQYGTTHGGGTGVGSGTVFTLGTDGIGYRVLHNFGIVVADGLEPTAGLVQGSDGLLYGTTPLGGTNNAGTVFKLNTDGTSYAVIHRFISSGGDAENPEAALTQASDGMLYGTTGVGGTSGSGTVFRMNTDGTAYAVLHNFCYCSIGIGFVFDGSDPASALLRARDGALYGVTVAGGGSNTSAGTVFRLTTDGVYTVLYRFASGGDGAHPTAELVQGSDGGLYGTTELGGDSGVGTVFRLSLSPLATPTGLSATPGDGQVLLAWNSSGAVNYNVKRSTTNGGPYARVATNLAFPAFTNAGLANGTVYYYVVSATNTAGLQSPDSLQAAARPVSMISPLLNSGAGSGQIQFSWPPNHTGWRLQMQTNPPTSGLGTNWATVPGSVTTNQLSVPIDRASGNAFFRLIYP